MAEEITEQRVRVWRRLEQAEGGYLTAASTARQTGIPARTVRAQLAILVRHDLAEAHTNTPEHYYRLRGVLSPTAFTYRKRLKAGAEVYGEKDAPAHGLLEGG